MVVIFSAETSVLTGATGRYIPEDNILQNGKLLEILFGVRSVYKLCEEEQTKNVM
jgi:hypothetical protein